MELIKSDVRYELGHEDGATGYRRPEGDFLHCSTRHSMLAFRVQLNDQQPAIGGADDLGVLTTTITAVGKLGSASRPHRAVDDVDIHLRLGGLTSRGPGIQDDHLVWFEAHDLKPGDKVSLEVIESRCSRSCPKRGAGSAKSG